MNMAETANDKSETNNVISENALEFSRRLYERTIDWYKNADSKAQIILTLNGALIAFLTSNIFKNPDDILKLTNKFSSLTCLLLSLMCLCLGGSIISALMCMQSRMGNSAEIEKLKNSAQYLPNELLFFGTIAHLKPDKFQSELKKISKKSEVEGLAGQIYLLSKNVSAKHKCVNCGFAFIGGALIFFLLGGISYLADVR